MKNSKLEKLTKRTILLLEETKKDYKKYEQERKQLYSYLVNKNEEEKWEKYVKELEEIMRCNK